MGIEAIVFFLTVEGKHARKIVKSEKYAVLIKVKTLISNGCF